MPPLYAVATEISAPDLQNQKKWRWNGPFLKGVVSYIARVSFTNNKKDKTFANDLKTQLKLWMKNKVIYDGLEQMWVSNSTGGNLRFLEHSISVVFLWDKVLESGAAASLTHRLSGWLMTLWRRRFIANFGNEHILLPILSNSKRSPSQLCTWATTTSAVIVSWNKSKYLVVWRSCKMSSTEIYLLLSLVSPWEHTFFFL